MKALANSLQSPRLNNSSLVLLKIVRSDAAAPNGTRLRELCQQALLRNSASP